MSATRLLRSLLFQIWMYGLMAICGFLFLPLAIRSREGAYYGIGIYLNLVFWGLRAICGLRAETRGPIPEGDVMVAAKHHSFLDVLILVHALPAPKFVFKRSLVWVPILGFYALRTGASPVTRGRGGASVDEMMRETDKRRSLAGQPVIYPQGTRVPPGHVAPYKRGAHVLYESYNLPCVPAAVNTGVFWPRVGVRRDPGVAVVEFLEPIPPGLPVDEFLGLLEARIEPAADRLVAEGEASKAQALLTHRDSS